MKKFFLFSLALVAAAGVLPVVDHHPALAVTMDCSKSQVMMVKAHSMVESKPTMSGDTDKDFAMMETGTMKAQIMMAHVEMMCGKTQAEKDSAAKLLTESEERLRLFRNQNTSM